MYLHVHACIHMCVHAWEYEHLGACTCVFICTLMCVRMHACMYIFALSLHKQGWSTRTHTCTRTYSSTFFSVLSCTLYLAKFMSTCTRTYLSTVAKNPVLMSTL